jgi:hypothetical protein
MKKVMIAAAMVAVLTTAACNRKPRKVYVQQTPVVYQQAGPDCDADDRYEFDTDCGYTYAQHKKRMAYLKKRGYKRKFVAAPVYRQHVNRGYRTNGVKYRKPRH